MSELPIGTVTFLFTGGVAVGASHVWVAHRPEGSVTSLDPVNGGSVQVSIGHGISDIAVGAGSVWVTVP